MAEIFPSLENINRLKVPPTEGELFLLKYLESQLPNDYEVYFQPFLNGDMPDIVIMRKNSGVIIIEVKDWNLSSYNIDEKNNWRVNTNNHVIRSPFKQVFSYKSNMFNLHINGLAERNVLNKNFYNILKTFVYFHGVSKEDIEGIFQIPEKILIDNKRELNLAIKNGSIEHSVYEKKMDYLDLKTKQINRDRGLSIYDDKYKLIKLIKVLEPPHKLFTEEIYTEFKRYLTPPFHVASQGRAVGYDKKQSRLIISKPSFQKIKGVAGAGKTTILAKRAVNAHKRHQDRVLILTYNKTLRNFIRDKISDVREDFSWGMFAIINYHSFIMQMINQCGIEVSIPDGQPPSVYFEKLYSNEDLFNSHEAELYKYQTILIDEVQDYQPQWIKIIRKYFLAENGEMVLYGDESQNIYERNISKQNPALVQGFGRWERLTKSYRSKIDSPLTSIFKKFQNNYLLSKYDIDLIDAESAPGHLSFNILKMVTFINIEGVYETIFKTLKEENIHPNDVCILSTNIHLLRQLDQKIRYESKEKTQTTFESEEVFIELNKLYQNNKSELQRELENIRGSKKFSFNLNSGLLKLSTVHSFKGLESHTAIYIITKEDNDEMVYTGITRSKENLVMFLSQGAQHKEFFETQGSIN